MTYTIEQQLADSERAWKAMVLLGQAEVCRFRATGEDESLSFAMPETKPLSFTTTGRYCVKGA